MNQQNGVGVVGGVNLNKLDLGLYGVNKKRFFKNNLHHS